MDAFSKKDRDTAMRIICDFHASREPGHSIGPEYLHHHGLPESVNVEQLVDVLQAMGYVTCKKDISGEIYQLNPTDSGR